MDRSLIEQLVGKELGPCKLEALIGGGASGAVFRARHVRLDRPVAVKVLPPSLHGGAAAEARFLREARLAAKLDDPRVVRVYDVGIEGQYRYIVMALVEGATLEDYIRARGPLGQPEAKRIMREVLLGLQAAHAQGIVHRDVKPGNVMIDKSGAVMLLDFGIAGGPSSGAVEDVPAGTYEFMAPEQAFAPAADPRMDFYAWACTYFYALTGRPPFVGSAPDLLIQHRETPAPDVRTLKREVAAPAAALLLRCMEKFPEKRPASVAEILAELDKAGFVLDMDASGSPFKILPPPVAPREGFAPPPTREAAPAPLPALGAVPPPPPPVSGGLEASVAAGAVFAGLWAFFFGRPWLRAVEADWTAGCVFFALAACGLAFAEQGPRRRLAGLALLVGMAGSFAGSVLPSLSSAPAEVYILGCLALACSGAGIYLALVDSSPDARMGASLIALGGAGLAAASAALKLSPSDSWVSGIPLVLRERWADWRETGGTWRWAGFVALYLAGWTVRLTGAGQRASWARKKAADGRVLNWNK